MMPGVLIDNDVIIKVAAYGLARTMLDVTTVRETSPAMLSVGRFVVRNRLARASRFVDGAAALGHFEAITTDLVLLEPTDEELALAANFESAATKANLELDGGESQLLAILLVRSFDFLLTGDKRAILAIATVTAQAAPGKIACFEQLMATILSWIGAEQFRESVCREPAADKTLAICCGCGSSTTRTVNDILTALESYTNHLRDEATAVLFPGSDLSALAA